MFDSSNVEYNEKQILDAFNEFQALVRKGEPFMRQPVFDNSRKLVELMRRIISGVGKKVEIENRQIAHMSSNVTEKDSERLAKIDEEREAASEEIERLFAAVAKEISKRVAP